MAVAGAEMGKQPGSSIVMETTQDCYCVPVPAVYCQISDSRKNLDNGSFEIQPCQAEQTFYENSEEAADSDDDGPITLQCDAPRSYQIGTEQRLIQPAVDIFRCNQGESVLDDMDFLDNLDDNSLPFSFPRLDSREVLYEVKRKKPKMIGQYLIGDQIGEGSYGKVKEALDSETLCRRAVKILKRRKLRKIPNGEAHVSKEIKLLTPLKHRNVIRLCNVFYNNEKQKMYIFMEFCVGSVQELLSKSSTSKFPVWQGHFYFVQLVNGLEYLHGQGIVHKDIKPGNLLLSLSETLKITDLGVAEDINRFAPDDMCSCGQGTPSFQAPEIAGGQSMFRGFLVDVWAAGITLFNFISGRYPFEGESIYKLYENICKADFTVPVHADPLLEDLLRGMLQKKCHLRYTIKRIKSHSWIQKKHPLTLDKVPLSLLRSDESHNMSVVPYLQQLYDCSSEQDIKLISEHELNGLGPSANGGDDMNPKDNFDSTAMLDCFFSSDFSRSLRSSLPFGPGSKASIDCVYSGSATKSKTSSTNSSKKMSVCQIQ